MSVGRYIMHQKLSDGSSGLIYRPNGRTVEQDLAAYLPEYRDSDAVPESLPFGIAYCSHFFLFLIQFYQIRGVK